MRIVTRIFLLIAYSIAIYLVMVSLTSGAIAGCGGGSPCDKILKSEWAYIGMIPVSIPAALVYGLLLVLPLNKKWGRLGSNLLTAVCISIILTVLWFVGIQVFVLGQICPFCMGSHLFGLAGAVLLAVQLLKQNQGKKPIPGVLLGVVATLSFVILQWILPQPDRSVEFVVETQRIEAGKPKEEPPAVVESQESVSNEPVITKEPIVLSEEIKEEIIQPEPEIVEEIPQENPEPEVPEEPTPIYSIHGGKFTFPLDEVPGIGDYRVPNVMLNLIDFACDHCREHYRVLRKRAPFFEEEIFFGVLPLALNERCNPYFSMEGLPDYANCEYARLALAVWRMAPDKYLEYVDWLCDESSPPASLDNSLWPVAKAYAEDLIGEDLLNEGWDDPWVDQMMNTLTELYGYNLKVTGQRDIPQQFLNQKLRFGSITSESSFNMIMGLNFPIEIKRRR